MKFLNGYFDRVPLISFSANNSINGAVHIKEPIGDGSTSKVFKNEKNPFVYKIIKKGNQELMEFLKPVFREVIIQTLLQSDERYGNRICRIYKLYRTATSLVLQLEPLECTLDERVESQIDMNSNISSKSVFVTNLLKEMYNFLRHFETTYGFYHNDLHAENIMTVMEGDPLTCLKLIDFGSSYVKFDGVKIGKDLEVRFGNIDRIIHYFYFVDMHSDGFSKKLTGLLKLYHDKRITATQFMAEIQSGGYSKRRRTLRSKRL